MNKSKDRVNAQNNRLYLNVAQIILLLIISRNGRINTKYKK